MSQESAEKLTILIVDDEEPLLKIMKKMLEMSGHKALTAISGEIALDEIKNYPGKIDWLILDLSMPKMSGQQVFEEVRKINTEIKIIISSGFGKTPETMKFLDMGATAILPKPFGMNDLLELIK
jgi:DNA-binding response OmpR family regulator